MGENMQLLQLKLRFILAGCIVSILGGAMTLLRGAAPAYLGLLVVGIVVLVVGLLWPNKKVQDAPRKDTE